MLSVALGVVTGRRYGIQGLVLCNPWLLKISKYNDGVQGKLG